jgi:hypothetical protein
MKLLNLESQGIQLPAIAKDESSGFISTRIESLRNQNTHFHM